MLVIAHHQISDPDTFWAKSKEVASSLPSNFKLHAVYPSTDGMTGTCVWEVPSVNEVQKFLDDATGDISENVCYEVNLEAAMGAPRIAMEATL